MFLELEEKVKKLETKVKILEEKLGISEESEEKQKQSVNSKEIKKQTDHKHLQTR